MNTMIMKPSQRRSEGPPCQARGRAARLLAALGLLLTLHAGAARSLPAQAAAGADTAGASATEDDFYAIRTLAPPEHVVLEVGGLETLPDGRLAVATRRGEVWTIENPYETRRSRPHFRRFAHGLHEPLGLAYRDGSLYAAQRGELTRLHDTDDDGEADRYETVYRWPLSGNYHEYSFGPEFTPRGNMLVTLNLAWVGRGASLAKWRGWAVEITPDGEMTPIATGLRSPAGFGHNLEGDLFYAENQGDWVGSGGITHLEKGDFAGSPEGLRWTDDPRSPLRLRPDGIPDTGEPKHVVAARIPGLKTPAVWFPHGILGVSTSDILVDSTGGKFGPFEGQLFVGDQGHSKILRVFLEKVDGVYQGAVFPFREGFASGVLRLAWGMDGSMFVGMTNRGWGSTGPDPQALQRVVWTGRSPFEARSIRARPDGFEIDFTLPVDRASAADPASYELESFTYQYHQKYGSPVTGRERLRIRGVVVSGDGRSVRLAVDGLREGYIHAVGMRGVRSTAGRPLLHPEAYYTLNRIPEGPRLALPAGRAAPSSGRSVAPAAPRPDPGASSETTAKRLTEPPADWGGEPETTIAVGTLPGLRFSVPTIQVRANSRVRLVFSNTDDMLHNFVVTRPGRADPVVEAAMRMGLEGTAKGYVPDTDDVLFHTALLQPDASETIYFRAPPVPGEYTYVCTYPGHGIIMRGTLRVTN